MAEGNSSRPHIDPTNLSVIPGTAQGLSSPTFVVRRHAAPESAPLLTPAFLARALLQWWWVVIPVSLLLSAISATAIWYSFKPIYRASAWMQIEPRTPHLVWEGREETDKPEQEQFINTQVELLRGPLVLGMLVSKPEIASLPEVSRAANPVEELRKELEIVPVGKSQLYEVVYEGTNPRNAAMLVNAVVSSYFELLDNLKVSRQQRVIDLLDQEQERCGTEVERLRNRMRDLGKEILGRDPFTGTPTAEAFTKHPLAAVHERLIQAEVDAKVLEVQVQALEESIKKEEVSVSEALVEVGINASPEVHDIEMQLGGCRATLERIESTAKDGKADPAYERLAREIVDLEDSRQKVRDSLRPRVRGELKAKAVLERQDELARLRSQLANQQGLEQMLRERYAQQLKDAGTSGERSLDLELTRSELARQERVNDMVADRLMAMRTEIRAPARVWPMQMAEPPTLPKYRYPIQSLALALLASLVLPAAVAILWEARVKRITHSRQLERLPNVSLLAEVARLPLRLSLSSDKEPRRVTRALDLYEESIDSLRTCLALPDHRQGTQVLAVTSAVPDEGKTSLATQLALSIARATHQPTLLIDMDLRSPDIHHIFGIENEPGLAKVLDCQSTFEEAVNTKWSDSIHVLPAGALHKSPHELFGSSRFVQLMQEARARYAHIVIDTPPILAASEALVISQHADGVVLCAMRGRSREDQVQLAHRRLQAAGANPLGVVLNAVPAHSYAFTYGSYSYRHSSV